MSRLIVKNIPPNITESRLREHFAAAQKGTVTDVKILYNQDGTSRRFGFIGFKSDAEAAAAREYFDRSYVGTARLTVQVVQGTKDAPTPRPNKRPRLEGPSEASPIASSSKRPAGFKSDHQATTPTTDKAAATPPSKKAEQLDQFLKVMQPRSKGKAWSNEDPSPITLKARSLKQKQQPQPNKQMDVDEPMDIEPASTEEIPEGVSDVEWMRRRMRSTLLEDGPDKAFEQSDDEEQPTASSSKLPDQLQPEVVEEAQSSRLFVRNLPYTCTEDELREHFSSQGTVTQVHITLDAATKSSKGVAFITFTAPSEATTAMDSLDGTTFQGRLLHIIPAIEKRRAQEPPSDKAATLKKQRADKLKQNAGKDFNWAMLYMNADAVASSIADRMKIAKADILGADSENAAVKLALAETHIINETKKYFEDEGVSLESFTSKARSDTVLLIKNIPYGTSVEELREIFAPYGAIIRLLIPPAGTIAVVEYEHASEAAKALKGVAYKRLKNSIIYLERGPMDMFTGKPKASTGGAGNAPTGGVVRIADKTTANSDDQAIVPAATLFVKNLAWATTSERLRTVFGHLPGFKFARVQQKPDPKHPGQTLNAGYGFVGFNDPVDAKKALAGMQNYVLDGHELAVKFAGRGTEEDREEAIGPALGARKSAKMIVKNVPFEASRKDLRELFGAHGHLKSVRLPKKFNSRSRGFAFLEYVSRQEAEHAFATLRHTHLLGRHLVLEWAAEADVAADVEALREKVRAGFGDGKELPGKKRKLDFDEDEAGEEE